MTQNCLLEEGRVENLSANSFLFPPSLDGVCFTERSLLNSPGLGGPSGLRGSRLVRPGHWSYWSECHGGHTEVQLCSRRELRWPPALGGGVMVAVAGDPRTDRSAVDLSRSVTSVFSFIEKPEQVMLADLILRQVSVDPMGMDSQTNPSTHISLFLH